MPAFTTLHSSDLTVVVGDNSAHAQHRAGYNGLWSMTHRAQPRSPFVPAFAGLNLEHILNGEPRLGASYFEPRHAPMELRVLGAQVAELYQPATPLTAVESVTRFELREPDVLEFHFSATPRAPRFPHDYLCFFWASYIHAPEDKSMYFRGGLDEPGEPVRWQQLCTMTHGRDATVCRHGHRTPLAGSTGLERVLAESLGPLGWDQPFFYGRCRGMTLLLMFALDQRLRLTHSPSGAGASEPEQSTNPAWDFQFVLPHPRVDETASFRARLIYRPEMAREDVLREFDQFQKSEP